MRCNIKEFNRQKNYKNISNVHKELNQAVMQIVLLILNDTNLLYDYFIFEEVSHRI